MRSHLGWKTENHDHCLQIPADQSGHFVWVDQPDVIIDAVKLILNKVDSVG